jgi:hypothetical protein
MRFADYRISKDMVQKLRFAKPVSLTSLELYPRTVTKLALSRAITGTYRARYSRPADDEPWHHAADILKKHEAPESRGRDRKFAQ